MMCAGTAVLIGCSNEAPKEEEKITATMLNSKLKEGLVDLKADGANTNTVLKISFRENDTTYGLNAEVDFRLIGNPLKVVADSTIKIDGATSSSLDLEMYAYEQDGDMFLQTRDKDGEYVRTILEDGIKEKIDEYDIFSKKVIDDETVNKILATTKNYEYTGKTKINNIEYHTLTGTIEDDVITNWINKYQSEGDTDEINLGMYIDYIPEEFGDVGMELYFDKEKKFSGVSLDYTNLVKAIAKDDDSVGKIQIMIGENDTSDIDIPKAKTVSMQELLE